MKLSFHGATRMVTGSCYLLEFDDLKVMVDCGMFQGGDNSEEMNARDLPFDVSSVDYLILTHAHIDHSGRLPWLLSKGFKGKFIATEPTIQLSELMLIDSAKIQEYDKREGRIKDLLFTADYAIEALTYFQSLDYNVPRKLSDTVQVEFFDAGHILGSAIVKFTVNTAQGERVIVFSGDLGHPGQKIVRDPSFLTTADYVILESTYGNRIHLPRVESVRVLREELKRGYSLHSNVIIPSFAVERSQELLYELNKFYERGEFKGFPVYFDTPLGISATKVYAGFERYYDKEALALIRTGDEPYEFPGLQVLEHHRYRGGQMDRGKKKQQAKGIIIAGSGMCTGGRVVSYLKKNISNPNASVIFIGYQAVKTLGREILENKGTVMIDGVEYSVKARVLSISGFSAHGDQNDLINWIGAYDRDRLKNVFITHGEIESSSELERLLKEKYKIQTHIPTLGESVKLD